MLTLNEKIQHREYRGELEFIFKDRNGKVIGTLSEPNLVKIQAKEILSHRLPPTQVWDPTANSGSGGWVNTNIDPYDQFAPRYICFGAAFDSDHVPLVNDPRYYQFDSGSGMYIPIALGVGAEYDGGLINAIPISEPLRPIKRVERVYFENSYQPAGVPLLQDDVRALNNVVVFETTLRKEEYNGFDVSASDYFTITEVVLAAGKQVDNVGACECDPHDIFLEGINHTALLAHTTGTATVSLDPTSLAYSTINEGDQIKIVEAGGTDDDPNILNQVSPYYLVISKATGGADMVLDRTPVDSSGTPLSGAIGVFKDGFRIFSHRILKTPFKKSEDFEIVVRWRIIMS